MKWTQWLNALIGIWFIISPWTLSFSQLSNPTWFSVVIGAILVIVSFWAAVQNKVVNWSSWQSWIALLMGILGILVTVSWGLAASVMWTNGVLGAVVIILNLFAMGHKE